MIVPRSKFRVKVFPAFIKLLDNLDKVKFILSKIKISSLSARRVIPLAFGNEKKPSFCKWLAKIKRFYSSDYRKFSFVFSFVNYKFLEFSQICCCCCSSGRTCLTLKAPNKNCSRRHFIFSLLSFEENKA